MATALVAFHVASHTEGLATAGDRALEWLLASVGVAVDAERAGTRKGLVAGWADVPVLALGERGGRGRGNVVVMLPWVRTGRRKSHGQWWRESLRLSVSLVLSGCSVQESNIPGEEAAGSKGPTWEEGRRRDSRQEWWVGQCRMVQQSVVGMLKVEPTFSGRQRPSGERQIPWAPVEEWSHSSSWNRSRPGWLTSWAASCIPRRILPRTWEDLVGVPSKLGCHSARSWAWRRTWKKTIGLGILLAPGSMQSCCQSPYIVVAVAVAAAVEPERVSQRWETLGRQVPKGWRWKATSISSCRPLVVMVEECIHSECFAEVQRTGW